VLVRRSPNCLRLTDGETGRDRAHREDRIWSQTDQLFGKCTELFPHHQRPIEFDPQIVAFFIVRTLVNDTITITVSTSFHTEFLSDQDGTHLRTDGLPLLLWC
jgi:hypothetical protein